MSEDAEKRLKPLELEDFLWPDGSIHLMDAAFPVDVYVANQRFEATRIVVAKLPDGDMGVLVASRGSGVGPEHVVLAYVNEISLFTVPRRELKLFTAPGGAPELSMHYVPSGNCACGSTLQSYHPWGAGARMIGEPRPITPFRSPFALPVLDEQ